MKDADGNRVKAVGQDATVDLEIIQGENSHSRFY